MNPGVRLGTQGPWALRLRKGHRRLQGLLLRTQHDLEALSISSTALLHAGISKLLPLHSVSLSCRYQPLKPKA